MNASEVQALMLKEFGVTAKQVMKGPHRSLLLFYTLGEHSVIVQVGYMGGWVAYASDGDNNAEDTLAWLKKLAAS